ncbi:hypothetical protein [Kingella sp. (in: b-proteobacteria)]|nr:hypothetical protein [Kingella sp. (in: b-proteobacteria)]MDO4657373.1 hypothetical protein [Kingella sp. (in: b-proteobacteria)]
MKWSSLLAWLGCFQAALWFSGCLLLSKGSLKMDNGIITRII